jgi:sec-independent protein translocase protein TatA
MTINSILLGIFGLGGGELFLIGGVLLLMFGGKKLPELMKGLGKGIKEFKEASTNTEKKDDVIIDPLFKETPVTTNHV